jgi:archaellum biogenesis ATPase FlaH
MTQDINDHLVLIGGESGSGKSASLKDLPNHDRVMYLNCESGKRLPFRNKFRNFTITDPYQVHEAFDHAQGNPDYNVIVVDTLTFLMDMFESQYVIPATNGQQAWGQYAQFFKVLMQEKVAASDKAVIFLAHTRSDLDEKAMEMKTRVPVKGQRQSNGIEAYFSTVVATKKVSLRELKPYR